MLHLQDEARGKQRKIRRRQEKRETELCLEKGYEGDPGEDEELGAWDYSGNDAYMLHHEEAQHQYHKKMDRVEYPQGEARGKQRKLRKRLEKKETEDVKERIVEDLNKCQLPRQYRLTGIRGSSAEDEGDTGKLTLAPCQKSMETTLYEETESSWKHVENMANEDKDKDTGQTQDEQDYHQTQVKQEQSKQEPPSPPKGEWSVPIGAQDDDRTRQKGRQKK